MISNDDAKFVWIFGENLGKTMDNNSWYAFLSVVDNPDFSDIACYFIVCRRTINKAVYDKLSDNVKDHIVIRNSLKHKLLYRRADMFYVTLSYRDILPDSYGNNNKHPKPTIYLQHGVTAIKKPGYKADSYRNSLFRFVCYGADEANLMVENNGLAEYQTYTCPAMPRWTELLRRRKAIGDGKQILWFITWRDYMSANGNDANKIIARIVDLCHDEKLISYLNRENIVLKICLHHLFNTEQANSILHLNLPDCIKIEYQSYIDVMQEIAESKLVITDYSSIGFDATFLNIPVVLYQFDKTRYAQKRKLLVDIFTDMDDGSVVNNGDLVRLITGGSWKINNFFKTRLMSNVDMSKVMSGYYTLGMMSDFATIQRNKISFIGYNFYGRGGTVSATKALAEGLMERGYLVDLYCLRKVKSRFDSPAGLVTRCFYYGGKSWPSRLKRLLKSDKYLYSLNYDINKKLLVPYVGLALKRFLATTNARTVVSTRETLHPFLASFGNSGIKNKIFYFHTPPDVINNFYPGIMDMISGLPIHKAAFVTDESRLGYKRVFNYDGYDEFAVTGNTIQRKNEIAVDDIVDDCCCNGNNQVNDDAKGVRGVTLMRLSLDRVNDINHMIDFARYLKRNKISGLTIDVYGTGDYVDEFIQIIDDELLNRYIRYQGLTTDPYRKIREHDFLVDFSLQHSFGMIYIEAILNGKPCFAAKNEGSKDVLKGVNNSIYSNWSDLYKKIIAVPEVSVEEKRKNYDIIEQRYGRLAVTNRFETLLDRRMK